MDFNLGIKMGKYTLKALLDTGAQCNIISQPCLTRMFPGAVLGPSTYSHVVGVTTTESVVAGALKINLEISSVKMTATFHVLSKCAHEIILGKGFITKHLANINILTQEITLITRKNKEVKAKLLLSSTREGPKIWTKTATTFKLGPKETKKIQVYPTGNILTKQLKFKLGQHLLPRLYADTQIVPGDKSTVSIRLTNTTKYTQEIKRDTTIGIFKILTTPIA